jgi:purine-binding chemotaxis protein CheW
MRLRFGLATTIIVLEMGDVPTGLVVDRVTDVLSMSPESIAPPRWQRGDGDPVVKGLGRRDDGVSIILDVPRLLSARDVHLDLPPEALTVAESATAPEKAA